jgi:two-component system KDP operon response regulator KdpE
MSEGSIPARVLIIDDEEQIRRFLRISLRSQGYQVLEAATAAQGLEQAATHAPDLVVLDLGLADADGKDVLKEIRSWSTCRIIVLSVRSSESEKVLALDGGANDYITKPFGIQEFLARVRNVLRAPGDTARSGGIYDDGHLHIDLPMRQVTIDGMPVHLTRKEFAVLATLAAHPGLVITQASLLKEIWGPSHAEDTQYLRNFIGRIRQKLCDDPGEPRYIETEPGVGYRFIDHQGK